MPAKNKLFFITAFLFLFSVPCRLFAAGSDVDEDAKVVDTSPVTENDKDAVPYGDDEFPQWARDMRRGEIISLGSVPFVGLWVVGGYGGYKYFSGKTDRFPNPFSPKDAFDKQEIWTMVGVTAGVSLGIGLTDFFVNLARRKKAERERLLQEAREREGITPLTPEEAGQLLRENNRRKEPDREETED